MNEMERLPSLLWAIPKIYTYSHQTEPFIHADGDVYIWEKFDKSIEAANLVAQSPETNPNFYQAGIDFLQRNARDLPHHLSSVASRHETNSANAGIFGGNDIDFIKDYSQTALDFIFKNLDVFASSGHSGKINAVVEQLLFVRMAAFCNKEITYLFNYVSESFQELINIHNASVCSSFMHMVGKAKKDELCCRMIENFLKKDYPDYYETICRVFPLEEKPECLTPSIPFGKHFTGTKMINTHTNTNVTLPLNDAHTIAYTGTAECKNDEHLDDIYNGIFTFEEQLYHFENHTGQVLNESYLYEHFLLTHNLFKQQSKHAILNIPFKKGQPFSVLFSAFHIPNIMGSSNWLTNLPAKSHTYCKDEHLFLLTRVDEGIKIEQLTAVHQLLYYYSAGPLTGYELIGLATGGEHLNQAQLNYYEDLVYDFILRSGCYFGHLVPAK